MKNRYDIDGRTAVITGAASGIGRAVALSLASRGCNVALVDLNIDGARETAAMLPSVRTSVHWADMGDAGAIAGLPAAVLAEHPAVDILVNNAGVALHGTFEEVSTADFEWLLSINLLGIVRMTRAFLPLLRRSDDARLVNVSSLFGLIAPPGQTAYCASKYGVRGFSDSLRNELVGSTVGVSVVHPGGVATNIARVARHASAISETNARDQEARFAKLLTLPPEQAGEIIVTGIEQRQDRILVGKDARRAALIERLFPVTYWSKINRLHR